MYQTLISQFKQVFSYETDFIKLRAPGRVNLIGEHTDYNNGFVLPAAINLEIKGLAAPRKDNRVNIFSMDYGEMKYFNLDQIQKDDTAWTNYIKGVARELEDLATLNTGADIVFKSNLPLNSGLSSSAAFEVINALLLARINQIDLSKSEVALLCQRAENNFVGVNCGIMDQFAVALAKKDKALFIDTQDLQYKNIDLNLADHKIILINTNKPRTLADSAYNERRKECENAVSVCAQESPDIMSLRDVEEDLLKSCKVRMSDTVYRRAKHVIKENNRVLESIKQLQSGNLEQFGQLMNESHYSLKDLYEVSCLELDVLVEEALKIDGVVGSRMTGAGFGGCTVSLVHNDQTEKFKTEVSREYLKRTNINADIYVTTAESGAQIL